MYDQMSCLAFMQGLGNLLHIMLHGGVSQEILKCNQWNKKIYFLALLLRTILWSLMPNRIYRTNDKIFYIVCIELVSNTWCSWTSVTNICIRENVISSWFCDFMLQKSFIQWWIYRGTMKEVWCISFSKSFVIIYTVDSFITRYFVCVFWAFPLFPLPI